MSEKSVTAAPADEPSRPSNNRISVPKLDVVESPRRSDRRAANNTFSTLADVVRNEIQLTRSKEANSTLERSNESPVTKGRGGDLSFINELVSDLPTNVRYPTRPPKTSMQTEVNVKKVRIKRNFTKSVQIDKNNLKNLAMIKDETVRLKEMIRSYTDSDEDDHLPLLGAIKEEPLDPPFKGSNQE